MIIRSARRGDVSAISGLEAELFGRDAWSPKVVEGEINHPLRRMLVAVEGENVIGYAVVFAVGDTVDLERVGVGLHHQRRGVARGLIVELELDTYPRVLLEVRSDNAAAIALYQAVGFQPVARRRAYYRDGGDALIMQRDPPVSG